MDEFTVGYGTRIGRTAFAKVDYIHRDWDNFYSRRLTLATGKVTDPFGNISDQSVTENDDGSIVRKYEGIQVQAQWTPRQVQRRRQLHLLDSEGQRRRRGAGTATIRNLPLKVYYPEYLAYDARKPIGYLPQDNKHRARALGRLYRSDGAFRGVQHDGASIHRQRESLFRRIGQIDATGRTAGTAYPGLPVNPGYTLSAIGTSHDYYFSERGAFRTDNVYSTDIGLNYSTPKIWGVEVFVRATLTNAFNQSALVNPNADVITRAGRAAPPRISSPSTRSRIKPIECTAPNAAGNACTVAGANWMKGPNSARPPESPPTRSPAPARPREPTARGPTASLSASAAGRLLKGGVRRLRAPRGWMQGGATRAMPGRIGEERRRCRRPRAAATACGGWPFARGTL